MGKKRLLNYCREKGRVCPKPQKWNDLYGLLPKTSRKGVAGYEPTAPLILGAWYHSSDGQKIDRLREHIEWADAHNELDKVSKFLYNLREEDWHHHND